jgi:hypothetical protein
MLGFSPLASAPLADDGVVVVPAQQGAVSFVSSSSLAASAQLLTSGSFAISSASSASITGLIIKPGAFSKNATGSVIFLEDFKYGGKFEFSINNFLRETEQGDIRITEDGMPRLSDSVVQNAAFASLVSKSTRIPFSSEVYSKYSGEWKTASTYVNVGGDWVEPEKGYIKISGAWKRIL